MSQPTRELGRGGPTISAIGLGCMGMSEFYGHADRGAALATIGAALEAGVTLFDTGDFYGMGHNELLLAEGLRGQRDNAFIQVKFGTLRSPDGALIGTDAAYAGYFHMRTKPMGWVSGRRTGTSRTLGKAAQRAAR